MGEQLHEPLFVSNQTAGEENPDPRPPKGLRRWGGFQPHGPHPARAAPTADTLPAPLFPRADETSSAKEIAAKPQFVIRGPVKKRV